MAKHSQHKQIYLCATEKKDFEHDCALFKHVFQSKKGDVICSTRQYPADFQTITVTNSAKPNMHVMSPPPLCRSRSGYCTTDVSKLLATGRVQTLAKCLCVHA